VTALDRRHAAFHELGCRASDHALATPLASFRTPTELGYIFASLRRGTPVQPEHAQALRTALLLEVGRMDAHRGWAMQLHLGAIRNLNSAMFQRLGPDTGYDAAGDALTAPALAAFLDALEADGMLPRTILYSLNPNDYEALASVMGCFQDGSLPGKLQLGSAWWFNDHVDGMRRQLTTLANQGLLSRFVGMLTDSRSFLSFPRHEYFRRVLCDLVGGWMEAGEAPADFAAMGGMVQDICYRNAVGYFQIPGVQST
jgi:glucuronate isomerase